MKDADYFSRIDPLKEQLYRVAYLYLGSESAAVDAVRLPRVSEAPFPAPGSVFFHLADPHPHQRVPGRAAPPAASPRHSPPL